MRSAISEFYRKILLVGCRRTPNAINDGINAIKELQQRKDTAKHIMALSFPNQSRSYDSTRHAVRFWGHDRSMEASFFVTADALRRLQPGTPSEEADLLNVFDSNRNLIVATAAKVFARGNKGSYELIASDF